MSRKNCVISAFTRPKTCNQTPRHLSTKYKYILGQGTVKVRENTTKFKAKRRTAILHMMK